MTDCLTLTPEGLYCPEIRAHIDPVRPVDRAVITHGHADHARSGHGAVLATDQTLDIMGIRYGRDFCGTRQALSYGDVLTIGGARVSLHPAGHVLGSAQVLVETDRERVVVSGDYKRQTDFTCAGFELVPCDTFVTEATFGLPVFRHPPAREEVSKLLASLELLPERTHLLGAYALGKAQRLIAELRAAGYERTIYLHGALVNLCTYYQEQGIDLGDLQPVGRQERSWPERSSCVRRASWQTVGRGGSAIRLPPLHPAGCVSGHGPVSAGRSCRLSSPITAIGRPVPDNHRNRCAVGLGDPWSRRGSRALV